MWCYVVSFYCLFGLDCMGSHLNARELEQLQWIEISLKWENKRIERQRYRELVEE
jgi:hypothetical protein